MRVVPKQITLCMFISSSVAVIFLLTISISLAHADTSSDFTLDVQRGLNAASQSDLKDALSGIKTQDHESSWDEFGTNVLVDGASTPADIQKSLLEDIVNDVQTQLAYNQKDEQYLRFRNSSPEEVIAVEGDGGNDLLPENYIEPNPSLEANPDANPSALDVPAAAIDTTDTSTILNEAIPESELSLPDNLVPAEGEWKPSDIGVFETILNSDASTDTPAQASPETAPAPSSGADTPAPDTPPAETPSPETPAE